MQRREAKRLEGIEEQKRKDATKGVKFNTEMEESLAQDEQALDAHVEMLGHGEGNSPPSSYPYCFYILTLPLQPLYIHRCLYKLLTSPISSPEIAGRARWI